MDYVLSQYLCEFIKKCGYAGVIYRLGQRDGINLALFNPGQATPGHRRPMHHRPGGRGCQRNPAITLTAPKAGYRTRQLSLAMCGACAARYFLLRGARPCLRQSKN
jgi:hypothetical protein